MYTYIYTCLYINKIHIYIRVYIYTSKHIYMYAYVHTNLWIHTLFSGFQDQLMAIDQILFHTLLEKRVTKTCSQLPLA